MYKHGSTKVGLVYTCPVCKSGACIEILHIVLVTSSWKKARGMFVDQDHMLRYIILVMKIKRRMKQTHVKHPQRRQFCRLLSNLHITANTSINDDSASISTVVECMSGERSHAMIPCGHKCLCTACATNNVFIDCLICRTPVQSIHEIYE